MGQINFQKGQGGLKRRAPGTDQISSLMFYSNVLPSGFTTQNNIQVVNQLLDAEALGIVKTTGTDILIRIMHYYISEFYRVSPGATLYVAILPEAVSTETFVQINDVYYFAEKKIRQIGIFSKKAFAAASLSLIQGILTALDLENQPISSVLYASNLVGVATSALVNLRALFDPKVSGVLAQDGDQLGASLALEAGYSVPALGALLGAISYSKVSECIGWVEKFPMDAVELGNPALANGTLVKTLDETTLGVIDGKGWIFLRKYDSDGQVYFNDSHTAIAIDNDYAYIEANRTMDKSIRGVRAALLPKLNGPVNVDAETGKLDPDYVVHLENLGDAALLIMQQAGELSGYMTFVDPDQNVLSTSTIEIAIIDVPMGVSRIFNVKISYATSTSGS